MTDFFLFVWWVGSSNNQHICSCCSPLCQILRANVAPVTKKFALLSPGCTFVDTIKQIMFEVVKLKGAEKTFLRNYVSPSQLFRSMLVWTRIRKKRYLSFWFYHTIFFSQIGSGQNCLDLCFLSFFPVWNTVMFFSFICSGGHPTSPEAPPSPSSLHHHPRYRNNYLCNYRHQSEGVC